MDSLKVDLQSPETALVEKKSLSRKAEVPWLTLFSLVYFVACRCDLSTSLFIQSLLKNARVAFLNRTQCSVFSESLTSKMPVFAFFFPKVLDSTASIQQNVAEYYNLKDKFSSPLLKDTLSNVESFHRKYMMYHITTNSKIGGELMCSGLGHTLIES